MELPFLVRTPTARRFGLVARAVVPIIAVAASGVVCRSLYAPALVEETFITGALVAFLPRSIWALYSSLFMMMLQGGLLPAKIQSNLNRGLEVIPLGT
jgi:hypothetical protein